MRILLLLLLAAVPARSGEMVRLGANPETPIGVFLTDMGKRCGWVVLQDPELDLRRRMMGFTHEVAAEELPDTVRAILAFYDVTLTDLGYGVKLACPSRSTNGTVLRPAPPGRVSLALLGVGGTTTLDFEAHSPRLFELGLRLLPETRDRLLLGLRFGLCPEGRARAARLLGAIGPYCGSTAAALTRALDDEDAAVRAAAARALTGRTRGVRTPSRTDRRAARRR
jgi:hypothetical protein